MRDILYKATCLVMIPVLIVTQALGPLMIAIK